MESVWSVSKLIRELVTNSNSTVESRRRRRLDGVHWALLSAVEIHAFEVWWDL